MKTMPGDLRFFSAFLIVTALLFPLSASHAGSATWSSAPATGDWNTAANWMPTTVPNNASDIATFAVSAVTNVSLSNSVRISSIVFQPNASSYTISATNAHGLTISGAGIVNNSGMTQTFSLLVTSGSVVTADLSFFGSAKAGAMVLYQDNASGNTILDSVLFKDTSSADEATFMNAGSSAQTNRAAGLVVFQDDSVAGSATFINQPGTPFGGAVSFQGNSSADHGTFICHGGTAAGQNGGGVDISGGTCDHGTFTLEGTDVPGATGGSIFFQARGDTADATFIANGGQVAGGVIRMTDGPNGGNGRIELFGNGRLDVSASGGRRILTTGSIEGDGLIQLGATNLTVGGNGLSTTFAGLISDGGDAGGVGGALTKVDSTTLELSGANTYTGGTTVNAGTLNVSNDTGSATGTGAVSVNGATLGGKGILSGAVTINNGAFLAPATGSKQQATLAILSSLTFNSGSTYTYTFKAKARQARTDGVIANGVAINGGATINLSGQVQGSLRSGVTFTVISNTSANSITGSFANLPDGSLITVGANSFLANYEGGDGNDLTLTAQ